MVIWIYFATVTCDVDDFMHVNPYFSFLSLLRLNHAAWGIDEQIVDRCVMLISNGAQGHVERIIHPLFFCLAGHTRLDLDISFFKKKKDLYFCKWATRSPGRRQELVWSSFRFNNPLLRKHTNRPICLLNVSLKIFTKIATNRLMEVAGKIVQPSQTAFMAGRNIMEREYYGGSSDWFYTKLFMSYTLRSLMGLFSKLTLKKPMIK